VYLFDHCPARRESNRTEKEPGPRRPAGPTVDPVGLGVRCLGARMRVGASPLRSRDYWPQGQSSLTLLLETLSSRLDTGRQCDQGRQRGACPSSCRHPCDGRPSLLLLARAGAKRRCRVVHCDGDRRSVRRGSVGYGRRLDFWNPNQDASPTRSTSLDHAAPPACHPPAALEHSTGIEAPGPGSPRWLPAGRGAPASSTDPRGVRVRANRC
jgi:hypothetical protein